MYRNYTSKLYGFYVMKLWVMGYKRVMGYGPKSPAYQLGNFKNLWGIREYGLSELWVKRASTVDELLLNRSGWRRRPTNNKLSRVLCACA
jgi:hypothetical protein